METDVSERLKLAVGASSIVSGRRQFSVELRKEIFAYATQQLMEGRTQTDIARELGVVPCTLQRWFSEAKTKDRHGAEKPPRFIEVTQAVRQHPILAGKAVSTSDLSSCFAVTLKTGIQIRVPFQFETPALRQLVSALEAR